MAVRPRREGCEAAEGAATAAFAVDAELLQDELARDGAPRLRPPVIRSLRILHEGWGRHLLADVELADGSRYDREIEDHGDAAALLPYDPERRTALLVRQLRVPTLIRGSESTLLEVPAGRLEGEEPEACARREAEEEVGLTLREVEAVGSCYAMPGISTERMHLFLAPYRPSDRTSAGGGLAEENERITVVEMPLAELAAMADSDRIQDMKTLCLLQALRLRRPELFRLGPV